MLNPSELMKNTIKLTSQSGATLIEWILCTALVCGLLAVYLLGTRSSKKEQEKIHEDRVTAIVNHVLEQSKAFEGRGSRVNDVSIRTFAMAKMEMMKASPSDAEEAIARLQHDASGKVVLKSSPAP